MATRMGNVKFKVTLILVLIITLMIVPMKVFANDEGSTNGEVKIGDINNDNKIDTGDLLIILRHIYAQETGKKQEWILTGNKFLAGDITGNGKIDSSDTVAILRYIAATGNVEIANRHPEWLKIDKSDEVIELSKSNLELTVGATETLTVKNQGNEKVNWSSSNANVAAVDNGKVTAKAEGEAIITAKTDSGKTGECRVVVKAGEIAVESIKLDKTSVELEVGKTVKLTATITPENATNKNITWTTSNDKVATVSGGTITAKGTGDATITAKTANGKEAKCTVKVKAAEILATSVKLDKTSLRLAVGKEETLKATIEPSNATNKTLTWTSSNTSVATVDKSGKVTAKAEGKTTITVKTSNNKTASCEIKVTNETSNLSEFLKSWENTPMWQYMKGEITNYDYSPYIYLCVTKDKKNYIMCDDLFTGNNNRNFGYGICFYVGSYGDFINVDYFKDEGINIKDSKYQNYGSSTLAVDIVDRIKERIIEDQRSVARKYASNRGLTLKDYQIDACAACMYQGWESIPEFLDAYKTYGLDSRIRSECTGMGTSNARYEANWKLFSTGKYIDPNGKEIDIDK